MYVKKKSRWLSAHNGKRVAPSASKRSAGCIFTGRRVTSATAVTTAGKYEVTGISAVFGRKSRKLHKVKWEGYPDSNEDTWGTEKILLEDGCREVIHRGLLGPHRHLSYS